MTATQRSIIRNVQLIGRELGEYSAGTTGAGGPLTLDLTHRLAARLGVSLPSAAPVVVDMASVSELMLRHAQSQIGVTEEGGNNRGKQIDLYEQATWLDWRKDWAWCASFVCWCIMRALEDYAGPAVEWKRPMTPAAFGFEKWARAQGLDLKTGAAARTDIRRGDIVVWNFSHISIATRDGTSTMIQSVDGNSNPGGSRDGDVVGLCERKPALVRSRIRLA